MNNAIERSNRSHCLRIWENLGQESDTATTGPKCEREREEIGAQTNKSSVGERE